MARQARSSGDIQGKEPPKACSILYCLPSKATAISDSVDTGEEDDGQGRKLMERDDVVEVNDVVQKPPPYD